MFTILFKYKNNKTPGVVSLMLMKNTNAKKKLDRSFSFFTEKPEKAKYKVNYYSYDENSYNFT